MIEQTLEALLENKMTKEEALNKIKGYQSFDSIKLDTDREKRTGHGEVIFGEGKTAEQLHTILTYYQNQEHNVLITRLSKEKGAALSHAFPSFQYKKRAELGFFKFDFSRDLPYGSVSVVCAGTSDQRVAEEAALTAEYLGSSVKRFYDVGVAGIHRLFDHIEEIRSSSIIIAIAGMEGALPSVLGGLVDKPLIAVPTSVGYGASFKGVAPLLTMLNSCAAGITVVNIDNGFGAAYAASQIHRLAAPGLTAIRC